LIKLLGKSIGRPPIMFSFPVKILALLANILGFKESYKRLAGSLSVDIEHTCTNLDWKPPHSVEYGFKKLRINK
jgi:UDP-glucose 4-epimerase